MNKIKEDKLETLVKAIKSTTNLHLDPSTYDSFFFFKEFINKILNIFNQHQITIKYNINNELVTFFLKCQITNNNIEISINDNWLIISDDKHLQKYFIDELYYSENITNSILLYIKSLIYNR